MQTFRLGADSKLEGFSAFSSGGLGAHGFQDVTNFDLSDHRTVSTLSQTILNEL